jgi:hypothetical protein
MDTPETTARDQEIKDRETRDQAPGDPPLRQPADGGLTTADLAREDSASKSAVPDQRVGDAPAALFPAEDARDFQARWDAVQVSFVDEPRRAVEQADSLVAEALKRQAEIFAAARADLEAQWDRGQDVSTEDLRLALQRYRAFFTRVLKV